MAPRIRFVRGVRGQRIAYAIDGAGPVLLFPAWWVSHVERDLDDPGFRALFSRLAESRTVVRYDRPGVGLSDRNHGELSLEEELATLEIVADECGDNRLALFGGSCGAPPPSPTQPSIPIAPATSCSSAPTAQARALPATI